MVAEPVFVEPWATRIPLSAAPAAVVGPGHQRVRRQPNPPMDAVLQTAAADRGYPTVYLPKSKYQQERRACREGDIKISGALKP